MTIISHAIRECANCAGLISSYDLLSWNTFSTADVTLWTDGKSEDLTITSEPFTKCPHCFTTIWLYEQKIVATQGECADFEKKEEKAYRPACFQLLARDYFSELNKKLSNRKEKYIRTQLWRTLNDERRDKVGLGNELSNKGRENLKALCLLFDSEIEEERIVLAEIWRELGDFKKAQEMLKKSFRKKWLNKTASFIKNLAEKSNSSVLKIK